MRPERRGHRVAAERQFGRPRSFAEIVQDEPALRALTKRDSIAPQRRKGDIWNRIETWAKWWLLVVLVMVLAVIFARPLMPAIWP